MSSTTTTEFATALVDASADSVDTVAAVFAAMPATSRTAAMRAAVDACFDAGRATPDDAGLWRDRETMIRDAYAARPSAAAATRRPREPWSDDERANAVAYIVRGIGYGAPHVDLSSRVAESTDRLDKIVSTVLNRIDRLATSADRTRHTATVADLLDAGLIDVGSVWTTPAGLGYVTLDADGTFEGQSPSKAAERIGDYANRVDGWSTLRDESGTTLATYRDRFYAAQ
jgi:hypothetical protein